MIVLATPLDELYTSPNLFLFRTKFRVLPDGQSHDRRTLGKQLQQKTESPTSLVYRSPIVHKTLQPKSATAIVARAR